MKNPLCAVLALIRETPSPSERTTASAEPSFAQRVRDFFTGLFSR